MGVPIEFVWASMQHCKDSGTCHHSCDSSWYKSGLSGCSLLVLMFPKFPALEVLEVFGFSTAGLVSHVGSDAFFNALCFVLRSFFLTVIYHG